MGKPAGMTGTQKKAQRFGIKQAKGREKAAKPVYEELLQGKYSPTTDIKALTEEFLQARKSAEKIYDPTRQNALRQFDQLSAPDIRGQFGAGMGQGSRSSAMTQALAAARGNLESQIQSDISGIGQNLLGLSQQNRTNQMSMLSNLTGNLNPALQQGAFMNPYLQKGQQQPSALSSIGGGAAQGAGTAFAAWQLAKLAAAPATGGASMAVPV